MSSVRALGYRSSMPLDQSWLVSPQVGGWAWQGLQLPALSHGNPPWEEHSIGYPQLYKQQRTTAKSKSAVITYWIVISSHEGLSGCAVSGYIYKATFSVACQNDKILREGICRKVPASMIPPLGFCMLGNNLCYIITNCIYYKVKVSLSAQDERTLQDSPSHEHVPNLKEENMIFCWLQYLEIRICAMKYHNSC